MYRADRGSSRALENVSDFTDQQFEDVFEEEDADDCSRITHEGAVRAGALHVAQRVFDLVVGRHGLEASDSPRGDRLPAILTGGIQDVLEVHVADDGAVVAGDREARVARMATCSSTSAGVAPSGRTMSLSRGTIAVPAVSSENSRVPLSRPSSSVSTPSSCEATTIEATSSIV